MRLALPGLTLLLCALSGPIGSAGAQEPPPDAADDTRPGRVVGVVVDPDGLEIPNVHVRIDGTDEETWTDASGRFTFTIPPGSWTLEATYEGMFSDVLPVVEVQPDGEATVHIQLKPLTEQAAFVITAPEVVGGINDSIEERRESAVVNEVLGNEQMVRSGDSNAAIALTRVTGLTLVDGRYAYVRGLGDRYSSTLLNGATLSSPEPERRVVPVDLFPTSFLDSIVVQKTFTPDLPGDFGGGAVILRTRGVPAREVAGVLLTGGITTGTTFTRTLRGPGTATDILGVGAPGRRLPDSVVQATRTEPLDESDMFSDVGFSAEELETLGEALPNRWGTAEAMVRPDLGLQAFWGRPFTLGKSKLGVFTGLTWDDRHRAPEYTQRFTTLGAGDTVEVANSYDFVERREEVNLGGLLNLGWKLGDDHELQSTTLLSRQSEGEDRQYEGFNRDVGSDIRITRVRWVERQQLVQQVLGRHTVPALAGLTPEWRYTFSHATRIEPDQREVRYDHEASTGAWTLSDRPEGNSILDSRVRDISHDGWLALTLPLHRGTFDGMVQAGAQLLKRDRAVDTRRFSFQQSGSLAQDPAVLALPPEQIFTAEHIDPDGFQIDETTRQTDNYSATQRLEAGWLQADLPLGLFAPDNDVAGALRLLLGARVERSYQRVSTFELFNPAQVPVVADLDTVDLLPSVAMTASFGPKQQEADGTEGGRPLQLRASYARTVSRPDFRELSPATFNDVTGGRETFGNPALNRARIDHADLRLEWYPYRGELVSLGGFFKHFSDPIEQVVVVSAQHSRSWANARSASTMGLELEVRKTGRGLGPFLERTFIAANVALVRSRVSIDPDAGIQTSDVRPLQGQAPWVVNAQIGWDHTRLGHSVWLSYNVSGPRIGEVGALGIPDVILQPEHRLDLTAQAGLGDGFFLRLRGRNLLDWPRVLTQGEVETLRVRDGLGISLTAGWNL